MFNFSAMAVWEMLWIFLNKFVNFAHSHRELRWQVFQPVAGHSGTHFHHHPLIFSPNSTQYLCPQYLDCRKPVIPSEFQWEFHLCHYGNQAMTYLYHTHQVCYRGSSKVMELSLVVITFMIREVRDGVQSMVLLFGTGLYDMEEWLADSRYSKTLLMQDLEFLWQYSWKFGSSGM